MNLKEYQKFCKRGLKEGNSFEVFLLGLGEETGEVLGIFKKCKRDGKVHDIVHVKEELGDVMWYIANICSELGLDLEEVIQYNYDKIVKRYNLKN